MSIADEKYVALTTYRSNGEAVAVPVWIADLGEGRVGFSTDSDSWKVKRLANDARVQLQGCNSRGAVNEGSTPVSGTGEVVSGAAFEEVAAAIKAKYGLWVTLIQAWYKLAGLFGKGSQSDCAVVITLD